MPPDPPSSAVNPDRIRRVMAMSQLFEDALQRNEPVTIEGFLAPALREDRDLLLRELLLIEWAHLSQKGHPVQLAPYEARFVEQKAVVQSAWEERNRPATVPVNSWALSTMPPLSDPIPQPRRPLPQTTGLPAGYEMLAELGRGGMGIVYQARDEALNRIVAIKQMRAEMMTAEGLARFRQEGKALAQLQHPHIVQVYAWHGEEKHAAPCIVMEYVEGRTLEDRLPRSPMDPVEAAKLLAILARAVAYAHEHNVVHRDLKPGNVLMGPAVAGSSGTVQGGFPRIADFGLAKLLNSDLQTVTGAAIGTPYYMSPEQAMGKTSDVGPASDTWALGVMLYRCLAGKLPFVGDSLLATLDVVKTKEPASLTGVPAELARVCRECLRKSPKDRPSAQQVAEWLEAYAAGQKVPLPSPIPGLWLARAAVVAVLLVVVAVMAGMMSRRGPREEKQDAPSPVMTEVKPARIKALQVEGFEWDGKKLHPLGVADGSVQAWSFDTHVTLEIEFVEAAYAYVVEFTAKGQEQLLYPVNDRGEADKLAEPMPIKSLKLPAGKSENNMRPTLRLNDEPKGGLQVFAVVASSKPLRPYAEWVQSREKLEWKRREGVVGAWGGDLNGEYRLGAAGQQRSGKGFIPDTRPHLDVLLKAFKPGMDDVRLVAVPVEAKE